VDVGLLTSTAGWFPRPAALRAAREAFDEGTLDEAGLGEAERAATREIVALQEGLGLDVLTDGQLARHDPVSWFVERLEGAQAGGTVRRFGHHYVRRPRIVGELSRPETLSVSSWSAAREAASRPVKAILTGPYALMDGSFDEHYGSRERCCGALAELVRAEVADLVAAGAPEIELAEPGLPARLEELDFAAAALARSIEPAAGRARTWIRLGCADLRPLLPRLAALPADGLHLDLAHAGVEVLEALGALPAGKLLAAGVIDVLDRRVETPSEIAARIERVLRHSPAERVRAAPDGGLRTLDADTAAAKLRALVAAAATH
jgi:5-methyltetrahydropteroyltriglutamate--homocysteine methyltransferase